MIAVAEHGTYARYSSHPGCRCDECRAAKANYMRERRANARRMAHRHSVPGSPFVADVKTHGTRAAYEEHGCRCAPCRKARAVSDAETYAKRKSGVTS